MGLQRLYIHTLDQASQAFELEKRRQLDQQVGGDRQVAKVVDQPP